MKVAVLQFFSWPERRVALHVVYERALERIEVMDTTGYDAVWLAEHHFNTFSVCPSVHVMATHVAARTRNLRIGMAVSLAAMYHPLRLAEEVALVDVLSGGRVNWGAGRGFDATEFRAFGIPRRESQERFRENVEIVLRAWTSERLTYHGRFHEFEGIEVLPKPLQRPHPPVWMAATSPGAIRWAAEAGHTIMMDPHASHAEIAAKRELYRTTLEAAGHRFADRVLPMARLLAVADTRSEAEEIARRGAAWTVNSYASPEAVGGTDRPAGEDPVERYLDRVVLWGTPDELVDRITALREEMFLDYLLCAPLSHDSFVRFTDKVLPRIS